MSCAPPCIAGIARVVLVSLTVFALSAPISAQATLVQPSYGSLEGLTILGYSNLGRDNWDRVADFKVSPDRTYAYTPNYKGFSILDVRNPTRPRVLSQTLSPAGTTTQYIDVLGNILLVKERGLRLFDVSNPAAPRELSFIAPDPDYPNSAGLHGIWAHEDSRGKFAFVSTTMRGYRSSILVIIEITDPRSPREVGRWWYPGQWTAGGETPDWDTATINTMMHDVTVYQDRAYLGYRDQGVIILDVSDIANPRMVGQVKWSPPLPGNTHSVGIVVPKHGGRPDFVVATDEIGACPYGWMRVIDVRNEAAPVVIGEFKLPLNEEGNCSPPDRPGQRFGIHDVDRMIRGNIVWSAWEEGGFWGVDISDVTRPRCVAYYVPPVRSDSPPGSRSGHADDVFIMDDGLIFGSSSDPGAGGFWAMRYTPGVSGIVSWNADESNVTVKRLPSAGKGFCP